MSHYKNIFIASIIVVTTLGLSHKKDKTQYDEIPPGTIRIDSNFFADETEITNFSYAEYTFWMSRIFGDSSEKYLGSVPKENVWLYNDTCYIPYAHLYFLHPAYRDYPAVGISQKQAEDYCKWRSDRVFELILIREGVIEYQGGQTSDNHFSIENYYNGKYNNNPPDLTYNIYPHYKLPSFDEWKRFRNFSPDKTKKQSRKEIRKHRKRHCFQASKYPSDSVQYNIVSCIGDSIRRDPTRPVFCDPLNFQIFFVYGNVSEWLEEKDSYIGGSWRDSTTAYFNKPRVSEWPTEYIGFRCVFEWRKYK